MSLVVILPFPDRRLHPNARTHWAAKAKATKKARADAGWIAKEAGASAFKADIVHVIATFHPASKRAFDLDGALSSCKAALDGVADAIGIDDSRFEITLRRGNPVPGGSVRLELRATTKIEKETQHV